MFFSTLYQLGLKSGVGADSLSEFFALIRVDIHIGVSPSALRTQLNEVEAWLTTRLLPVVYWHHKMQQTKKPKTKEKYRQAWEQASDTFKADPFSTKRTKLPESEMEHWLAWADNTVRQFHRSSSAAEGRKGCLSQMYLRVAACPKTVKSAHGDS